MRQLTWNGLLFVYHFSFVSGLCILSMLPTGICVPLKLHVCINDVSLIWCVCVTSAFHSNRVLLVPFPVCSGICVLSPLCPANILMDWA